MLLSFSLFPVRHPGADPGTFFVKVGGLKLMTKLKFRRYDQSPYLLVLRRTAKEVWDPFVTLSLIGWMLNRDSQIHEMECSLNLSSFGRE